MADITVGIIGYGYWGPNLVRNFAGTLGCRVKWVSDFSADRLAIAKKQFSFLSITQDYLDLINDPEVDAIIIATPVFSHFKLGKDALNAGKHVLIEKPLTSSVADADELKNLAEQKGLLLMVDHTFLYTGAVQKIKDLVDTNEIGALQYLDSSRINLGLFQPDINVLWDLAPHDISILSFINGEIPVSVNATGISHTHNGIENVAYLTLNFQSNFIAHFNCSWSSPVKIRSMLIGGDEKMIVFNDLEPTEKVRVYDTGYQLKTREEQQSILVDYRVGDIYIPKVETKEALHGMATDFVDCLLSGGVPVSNIDLAIYVVKVLEAAQKSIKDNGREVKI
jgi:predicted dehydrogenase